jgi:hypothetical protein
MSKATNGAFWLLSVMAVGGAPCLVDAAATAVGEAEVVVRSVTGTLDSGTRPVAVEDPVFWQELIETGDASATKLIFADNTALSAGPRTSVRIDEFVYAADLAAQKLVIGVTKGIMRFVSGKMQSDAYEVRTPAMIIGVRGTDFSVSVDPGTGSTTLLVGAGTVRYRGLAAPPEASVDLKAGQAVKLASTGPTSPPAPPSPPSVDDLTVMTEATALLAIHGSPADAVAASTLESLKGRSGKAREAIKGLIADQKGSSCGGC